MKRFFALVFTLIIIELLLQQCANTRAPSGGPRDTIPPSLILSIPEDQTINFKEQEITLYFDEFIKADKLTQQLIITPNTDIKYKHVIKKRSITIKFEQPLEDSSTYTFNFFDGVTDITESNPAENLILAISTGHYIDSLQVIGKVTDLFTGKSIPKAIVGLYKLTDSLDLTAESPYYFISSDDKGQFELKNLKAGEYRLMSFSDENRNLKLDPATEAFAFLTDTIRPSVSPDSLFLKHVQVNSDPLKFISARPSGLSFDVRYNKPIVDYFTIGPDSTLNSYSKLNAEGDAISFYNLQPEITEDSTTYIVTARDSINNYQIDTVHVKFRKSSRKVAAFEYQLLPARGSLFSNPQQFQVLFSKPILSFDTSFLSLELDTIATIPLAINNLKMNHNNTVLTYNLSLSQQQLVDTLNNYKSKYEQTDTLNIDSLALKKYKTLERLSDNNFNLKVAPAAFISVDTDTSQQLITAYKYPIAENFGQIKLRLQTSYPSYEVQVLDKSGAIYTTRRDCSTCTFNNVPPNEYYFRILIDNNDNGKWDITNINQLTENEEVIIFSEKSILRANWTLELEYSF